jgi:uncharacterized phage-associated protein
LYYLAGEGKPKTMLVNTATAYDAKAIANGLLKIADAAGSALSPMKLQKLVYYAHGWNLAINKRPLINERIEAWKFGPVVPSLYHAFKEYGSTPIKTPALEFKYADAGSPWYFEPSIDDPCGLSPEETEFTKRLLRRIWEQYGKYTGEQLSEATHRHGTPWHQVRSKHGNVKNVDIPDELIRSYFESIVTGQK